VNQIANPTVIAVVAVLLGFILGAALIYLLQQRRTRRLMEQFGPEYDRTVAESPSRLRAESQLIEREKRVQQFRVRHLNPTEQSYFRNGWREVQARFVDDPTEALQQADRLIGEVMAAEGYPALDFAQRAADVSVHHAGVTQNYRDGHEIAVRNLQGQATTEDLRQAMIHYRSLFNELTGEPDQLLAERASWQTTKPH
jgi:hypothetical protein